ncbi:MAG TPA: HAD family phosphatase [bacterium]|nr:HAD family phosphatase [bacterium]
MPVHAVLFDFNGVIIDDEPLHMQAWRQMLDPLGIAIADEDFFGELLGIPDYDFLRRVLAMNERTLSAEEIARLHEAKNARYNELILQGDLACPGAVDFVRDLAAHVPLGVVSGALRGEIVYHLERLGLSDCFKIIVASGEYPACKPDPAPYRIGLQALNAATGRALEPAHTVVVEDSGHGVASGRAAGMSVLGYCARVPAARLGGSFKLLDDFSGYTFAALAADLDGGGR